jgi:hypothetical protein
VKEVNTNWQKYVNKFSFISISGKGDHAPEKDPAQIERENKIKEICLNCTKEKCTGGRSCFERERKKYK